MVDLKKAADDLSTKAVLAAAKSSAERALEDALSSDEERAAREAEREALAKKKRTKLVVVGVLGLLCVLGLVGLVLSYWPWFLLAGVLGLLALYGRHRWRAHRAERKRVGPSVEPQVEARLPAPPARVATAPSAEPDGSIEDELAQLKARLDKDGRSRG